MDNPALLKYYTVLYAQALSPCGKYLAAASNFGKIAIFNLGRLLSSQDEVDIDEEIHIQSPIFSFKGGEGPVFSLVTDGLYLISGGSSSISGWAWKDLLNKTAKVSWSLMLPKSYSCPKPEVNALELMEMDGIATLFAGCGDNNIYVIDLESQKIKSTFSGHTNYVHCLALTNEDRGVCWSGGEDGLALAWDTRTAQHPVHRIEPYKNELCHRPNFGKWIGCIAVDGNEDWMVCGGGPTLSLWHLRSVSCNVTFPTPKSSQTCVMLHEDVVVSAGTESNVYRWSFNGIEEARIMTTPFSIYSLLHQNTTEASVLCVAGSSTTIDVCSNLKYKDFTLNFQ